MNQPIKGTYSASKGCKGKLSGQGYMVLYRLPFDEDIMDKMYDKYPETREMLSYIDVCVDGRFVEELKDMMLKFKGSSNQRTILVQQSLKEGTVVTAEEYQ